MPFQRELPDDETLVEWWEEGLTFPQMAARFNSARTGKPVTGNAFGTACRRLGLGRNLHHDEWLPRNMHPDHQKLYDTEMIRRWSARRQGKQFEPEEDQRINAWLQALNDAGAILWYERETQQGWWPVKREPTDDPNVPVRVRPQARTDNAVA